MGKLILNKMGGKQNIVKLRSPHQEGVGTIHKLLQLRQHFMHE